MPVPSRTRYAVLGMLASGPMTGYALREAIRSSVSHFWSESDGQLYPALRTLEADGLISTQVDPQSPRGRAVHRIQPAGLAALRAWLDSEPPPGRSPRDELLLQVFFGRHGDAQALRERLQRRADGALALVSRYRELEQALAQEESPDLPYWQLTLGHGIALAQAQAAWAERAARVITEVEG